MLSGGSASGTLVPLGGSNPTDLFGFGSMLAEQALQARRNYPLGAIFALVLPEPSGGASATGTITVGGPATNAGTLNLYIIGEPVSVPVLLGDTASTIAANIAAAINAGYTKFSMKMGFPVIASAASAVVTLTARHKGTSGNGIRMETGLVPDGGLPSGVTLTFSGATLSGGAGDVDAAAALALLGDAPAEYIASPFSTVNQLNAVKAFLSNAGSGRWSPTVMKDGHYFAPVSGSLSSITAFGAARNDPHVTLLGLRNQPGSPWGLIAAYGAMFAASKDLGRPITEAVEISRPMQGLTLEGFLPPSNPSDSWSRADREALYSSGIAALVQGPGGDMQMERVVTTYQTNAYGTPDATFLDAETLAQGAYIRRYFRQRIESLYPRHVLMDENPRGLQGVATVRDIRASTIHVYNELCDGGICENRELFAKYLIVERSANPNRVNAYLPSDVANQLRVFAANITLFTQMSDALLGG